MANKWTRRLWLSTRQLRCNFSSLPLVLLRAPNVRWSPLVESLTPPRNECLFMEFQLCFSGRCIVCFSLKLIESFFLNHQFILLVGPHHNFGEYVQNFLRTKVHSTQWLKWIFSLYTLNDRKLFLPPQISDAGGREATCPYKSCPRIYGASNQKHVAFIRG